MNDYINNFIQHTGQIDSFLASAALWIGFAAIGSLFIAQNQGKEATPFLGWAVVSLFFTIFGVFTNIPFTFLAGATLLFAIASGIYCFRHKDGFLPTGILKIALLGGPLILLVSAMVGSQWDEFSDWLISPRLLLETDAFPNGGNIRRSGSLAAYPYSWHYVTYLASRLSGRLLENAGALVNVFMLLTIGLMSVRLLKSGAGINDENNKSNWGIYALGGLFSTVLSTTFAQKVALTSYADVATACVLGVGGLFSWYMLEALAEEKEKMAQRYAIQIGLLMMLLVNLKQSTVVLFIILFCAIIITGIRDPRIRFINLISKFPWIIVPPIIIFLLWRYYITTELPHGEMTIRPISSWLFEYIPDILQRMLLVLSKKGAFLALCIIIVGFGINAMLNLRTSFDRLALLVALVFLGHNAFLFFAYVSTFGKMDALRAASYWRYNMQLGMLGVMFMSYGTGLAWRNYGRGLFTTQKIGWVSVCLILLMPFVFANKLRFDRFQPIPYYRIVGAALNELLTKGDRLFVLDPIGTGESAMIARYEMGGSGIYTGYYGFLHPNDLATYKILFSNQKYTHVLIHSFNSALVNTVKLELVASKSYLLEADGKGNWQIVQSWNMPDR